MESTLRGVGDVGCLGRWLARERRVGPLAVEGQEKAEASVLSAAVQATEDDASGGLLVWSSRQQSASVGR